MQAAQVLNDEGPSVLLPPAKGPCCLARLAVRMRGEEVDRKDAVMWWNGDIGWGGWLAMMIGMAGFWILVAVLVVALVRSGGLTGPERPDARETLERRMARGEIDVEDYQQRLEALSKAHR